MGHEEGRILQSLSEVFQSFHVLSLSVRESLISTETQQDLTLTPKTDNQDEIKGTKEMVGRGNTGVEPVR